MTIGKAGQLSGLSRFEFGKKLSKSKISISNLTKEDIINDSEKLKCPKKGKPTPKIAEE
ncbi:MAG: UPF0175 family protein [Marinirhabdus sp.]